MPYKYLFKLIHILIGFETIGNATVTVFDGLENVLTKSMDKWEPLFWKLGT